MTRTPAFMKWIRAGNRVLVAIAFSIGVIVLLMYLAGMFSKKVPTTGTEPRSSEMAKDGVQTEVRIASLPIFESAIGEVQSVRKITISSELRATVKEVNITAGEEVGVGKVLIRLDDADLKSRLKQAEASIASIKAKQEELADKERRYANLVKKQAVSEQAYNEIKSNLKSTEANLQRAEAFRNETLVVLDKATVRAPFNAIVIDKQVNVGDTVMPGQPLVKLFDQEKQLVADVRESLANRIHPGEKVGVEIDAVNKICAGTIKEVVPEARPGSRSLEVKVAGPCPPSVYIGMSGKILVPVGREDVMLIPSRAIRHVGQVEQVNVVEGDRVKQRTIRTGRVFSDEITGGQFGDEVEVLSGLEKGEKILVPKSNQAK